MLIFFVFASGGCSNANDPTVYLESQGKVASFKVNPKDPEVRITRFLKLSDGSVNRPIIYYSQYQKTAFGGRMVEKSGRTFRTISQQLPDSHRIMYLPVSQEIEQYLFLVCTSYPLEVGKDGKPKPKTKYLWADWQLLEIPAEDVSAQQAIVIPFCEELKKLNSAEGKNELLADLKDRYKKVAIKARERAGTSVKPVGKVLKLRID